MGTAHGRNAGRPAGNAVAGAAPAGVPVAVPVAMPVPAPVGRPSVLGVEVLPLDQFYRECLRDVRSATRVDVASYIFDHPALTDVMERRFWGSTPFAASISVDKESFEGRSYVHQRPRLRRLYEAGGEDCTIHLCRGTPPHGSMHVKALIVDRRRLYMGSANFTYKSDFNVELALRVTGPPVNEVLGFLNEVHRQGIVWDGD